VYYHSARYIKAVVDGPWREFVFLGSAHNFYTYKTHELQSDYLLTLNTVGFRFMRSLQASVDTLNLIGLPPDLLRANARNVRAPCGKRKRERLVVKNISRLASYRGRLIFLDSQHWPFNRIHFFRRKKITLRQMSSFSSSESNDMLFPHRKINEFFSIFFYGYLSV